MVATTDQKARLLDLTTGVLELVRDGKRGIGEVLDVFQVIKNESNFATILGRSSGHAVASKSKPVELLLSVLGTVTVSAMAAQFVARERFVVNIKEDAPVKVSFLGSNFQEWFLGKTEEPAAETELRYAKLMKFSVDGPILAELGDKAETTLAQIYALMERQANGEEEGVLLTNGWANIFYVRDANGELRAVHVYWRGGGWDVRAPSVAYPLGWRDGHRVFSRNS